MITVFYKCFTYLLILKHENSRCVCESYRTAHVGLYRYWISCCVPSHFRQHMMHSTSIRPTWRLPSIVIKSTRYRR